MSLEGPCINVEMRLLLASRSAKYTMSDIAATESTVSVMCAFRIIQLHQSITHSICHLHQPSLQTPSIKAIFTVPWSEYAIGTPVTREWCHSKFRSKAVKLGTGRVTSLSLQSPYLTLLTNRSSHVQTNPSHRPSRSISGPQNIRFKYILDAPSYLLFGSGTTISLNTI